MPIQGSVLWFTAARHMLGWVLQGWNDRTVKTYRIAILDSFSWKKIAVTPESSFTLICFVTSCVLSGNCGGAARDCGCSGRCGATGRGLLRATKLNVSSTLRHLLDQRFIRKNVLFFIPLLDRWNTKTMKQTPQAFENPKHQLDQNAVSRSATFIPKTTKLQ